MDIFTPHSFALAAFMMALVGVLLALRRQNGREFSYIESRQSEIVATVNKLRDELSVAKAEISALRHQLDQKESLLLLVTEQVTEMISRRDILETTNRELAQQVRALEARLTQYREKYG